MQKLTKDSSRKLTEFLKLTLKGPDFGLSTTTETSEATETCENSENSENSEGSETKEGGESGTSENSEDSESSEDSETSEDSENSEDTENSENKVLLEKIIAVNPSPDEWGPIVEAAETILTTRIAKS